MGNSGWLVGPPECMTKVLACMLKMGRVPYDFKSTLFHGNDNWPKYGSNSDYDDQDGLAACMFEYPELITLDYTGSLVFNSYRALEANELLSRDGNSVHYKATNGSTQCFLHGPGDSYKKWFPPLGLI